jgi:RNA polymerase sigma-70 factor (ECF subfamily)
VVFSEIDRNLLERCLARKPRGWEDFVNRFLALFYQVVDHTASLFNLELSPSDRDDICAEILLRLVENDFAILRRFRGQASLASYLAVVGRRIAVKLLKERVEQKQREFLGTPPTVGEDSWLQGVANRQQVEHLLSQLPQSESRALRLFYLEGKSYADIARELDISPNSVGPILARARDQLRRYLSVTTGRKEGVPE